MNLIFPNVFQWLENKILAKEEASRGEIKSKFTVTQIQ